MTEVVHI